MVHETMHAQSGAQNHKTYAEIADDITWIQKTPFKTEMKLKQEMTCC